MKKCVVCGEPTEHRFCDAMCARVHKRREERKRNGSRIHTVDQCSKCGDDFMVMNGQQKMCPECAKNPKGYKTSLGDPIDCIICGTTFPKHAPNAQTCRKRCASDGRLIECARCGEEKAYDEFYDNRGMAAEKFIRVCKECLRKKALENYRRKKDALRDSV